MENLNKTFKEILNHIKTPENLEQIQNAYKKTVQKELQYLIEEKKRQLIKRLEVSGLTVKDYQEAKEFKFLEFYYYSNGKTKHSKSIIQKVRKWWKEDRKESPFLILFGEKGTGKTRLAKKIAIAALKDKTLNVYYTDKKQIDKKIYDFDTKEEFLDFLMEVKLLVIDDLLTGYSSEFSFAQIYTVLDHRYQQGMLTILTMNEDIRKHREKKEYEDINLLADRLEEVGLFIHFDYPSLRNKRWIEAAKNGDIRHLQKETPKKRDF